MSPVSTRRSISARRSPDGFEVRRFALYDAREDDALPNSARAALQARALDVATFFSPRAAAAFAALVTASRAWPIPAATSPPSPSARQPSPPLGALPFKATVAAARPTRQAVLDEIDRLAEAGVQGQAIMSDTPSSAAAAPLEPPMPPPVQVRRGLGVFGAFVIGLVAAVIVLAGAVISLPYLAGRGAGAVARPGASCPPRADTGARPAAVQVGRQRRRQRRGRDGQARAHGPPRRSREAPARAVGDGRRKAGRTPTPPIAELRSKVEALESAGRARRRPTTAAPSPEADKEMAVLRAEIATLHTALQALDQSVTGQREQTKALGDALTTATPASRRRWRRPAPRP